MEQIAPLCAEGRPSTTGATSACRRRPGDYRSTPGGGTLPRPEPGVSLATLGGSGRVGPSTAGAL
jgi:hypothetical protein